MSVYIESDLNRQIKQNKIYAIYNNILCMQCTSEFDAIQMGWTPTMKLCKLDQLAFDIHNG